MSDKNTTGITWADALAPFTGFAAARFGAELLPLLDHVYTEIAPFGAYAHAAAVPLTWGLFLVSLATVLVRYTVRYYRRPADAEEASETRNEIFWYVAEDFLPDTDEAEPSSSETATAARGPLKTLCRLTQILSLVGALCAFALALTEFLTQLHGAMLEGTPTHPLPFMAAVAAQILFSAASLYGNDKGREKISQLRRAAAARLRPQQAPSRGSYLLSEETELSKDARVPPDWHGRPREYTRADTTGTH